MMSKFKSIFSRGDAGSGDVIDQSTAVTMAHLKERNQKFQLFMRQEIARLEGMVMPSVQSDIFNKEEEDDLGEEFYDQEQGESVSNDEVEDTQLDLASSEIITASEIITPTDESTQTDAEPENWSDTFGLNDDTTEAQSVESPESPIIAVGQSLRSGGQ